MPPLLVGVTGVFAYDTVVDYLGTKLDAVGILGKFCYADGYLGP
jgi:hypothetical protein